VAAWVAGADTEPSGSSPDVSQRELPELESGFHEKTYFVVLIGLSISKQLVLVNSDGMQLC
jgi:hypothetical protein